MPKKNSKKPKPAKKLEKKHHKRQFEVVVFDHEAEKQRQDQERTRINKKAFLLAFENSFGNITASCRAVGICRQTYYDWKKTDEKFSQDIENIEPSEMMVDLAEGAMVSKIISGDVTAILFLLRTKGKKRGYSEKETVEDQKKEVEQLSQSKADEVMKVLKQEGLI